MELHLSFSSIRFFPCFHSFVFEYDLPTRFLRCVIIIKDIKLPRCFLHELEPVTSFVEGHNRQKSKQKAKEYITSKSCPFP